MRMRHQLMAQKEQHGKKHGKQTERLLHMTKLARKIENT